VRSEVRRSCQVCGALFPADSDACPVCALRGVLGDDHLTNELAVDPTPSPAQFRFGHYEVLTREDGKLFELGRGSMGVTYKAFDVDLRYPVALKVIAARYLGDESARLRFIREARAAASVRHPNVASVFHLGKSGESYFYAMEFVEGEPLDRILKYRGPLAVGLALDILDQVAAALNAAYRQNIVHCDIKPANLMVSFAEGGRTTVKVIDFGLARPIRSSAAELGRSEAGAFIGTPHFASYGMRMTTRRRSMSSGKPSSKILSLRWPTSVSQMRMLSAQCISAAKLSG
jgi:protein kinase-like protein